MAAAPPTRWALGGHRQRVLLLAVLLGICGMAVLLAGALAPSRAGAGSVTLGEIFPGPSVFASEQQGRRRMFTGLADGDNGEETTPLDSSAGETVSEDGVPSNNAGGAEEDGESEEASVPNGEPAAEDASWEGETTVGGETSEASAEGDDSAEAEAPAVAEEAPAGETAGEEAPAHDGHEAADAPAESAGDDESAPEAASQDGDEEDENSDGPSNFLKGMVQRVAAEVLPPEARAKLRDSSEAVKAANLQLADARKLQRASRHEGHKALLLAKKLAVMQGQYDAKHARAAALDASAARAKAEAGAQEADLKADEEARASAAGAVAGAEAGAAAARGSARSSSLAGGRTRGRGRRVLPARAAPHVRNYRH